MEDAGIQLLKAEVEKLKVEQKEAMGRMFVYETTFATILGMWGRPASEVEAELNRALEVVANDVSQQGVDRVTMIGFNAAADPFTKVIAGTVKRGG